MSDKQFKIEFEVPRPRLKYNLSDKNKSYKPFKIEFGDSNSNETDILGEILGEYDDAYFEKHKELSQESLQELLQKSSQESSQESVKYPFKNAQKAIDYIKSSENSRIYLYDIQHPNIDSIVDEELTMKVEYCSNSKTFKCKVYTTKGEFVGYGRLPTLNTGLF